MKSLAVVLFMALVVWFSGTVGYLWGSADTFDEMSAKAKPAVSDKPATRKARLPCPQDTKHPRCQKRIPG